MIFVVEDDDSIGELICCTLNTGGFDSRLFENGELFFADIALTKPDLILLDIMLIGMDGFEILKKLQSDPSTADIPVIFLTARTSEVDKVMGLEHGADDYIAKPFGVLELLARIKAVLRRRDKAERTDNS
jgi:two-component system alkaline phosphatase synthesis response regulator PhoP